MYPQAQETLAHYRQAGARIIIISATAEFIVKEVAHLLGVQEVIAIKTASFNQRLTGQTIGTLSYQAGKVTRLKRIFRSRVRRGNETAYFYSDSQNDLPLLNEVAFPTSSIQTTNSKPMLWKKAGQYWSGNNRPITISVYRFSF